MYTNQLKALLSPQEHTVFRKLNSPQKIQDFLDTLPINYEEKGETLMSPRRLLEEKKAHCLEGALFAAAALAYHGQKPLLLDFQTLPIDEDHVITIFKQNGLWGAISKTNHAMLRWRDPVYKTIRELAMSYFHEYLLWNGKKSLRTYSKPFDLRRYHPKDWVISPLDLDWIAEDIDQTEHFSVVLKKTLPLLRRASIVELKAMEIAEWKGKHKITYTLKIKKESSQK